MTRRRHDNTYARLVANTAEPDSPCGCWVWTGKTRRHAGGPRPAMNVRRDGKHCTVNAVRVMLEQFGPLPDEHDASHLCTETWLCIHPDHVIGEPFAVNIQRRWGRHAPLPVAAAVEHDDPDWRAGVPAVDPDVIPF